jgi:chaperonin GroES
MDVTKLVPMQGYVLVEPDEQALQTKGGIYLPEATEHIPQTGTLIAVGEGVKLKVKTKVLYKKWGGNDVTIEEIKYQFLREEDILAVIQ